MTGKSGGNLRMMIFFTFVSPFLGVIEDLNRIRNKEGTENTSSNLNFRVCIANCTNKY